MPLSLEMSAVLHRKFSWGGRKLILGEKQVSISTKMKFVNNNSGRCAYNKV
jgi:hypothetical protein